MSGNTQENFWVRSFIHGCSLWSLFNLCQRSKEGRLQAMELNDKSPSKRKRDADCMAEVTESNQPPTSANESLGPAECYDVQTKQPEPYRTQLFDSAIDVHESNSSMVKQNIESPQLSWHQDLRRSSNDASSQSFSLTSSCQSNYALESSGISEGRPESVEATIESADVIDNEILNKNEESERDGRYFKKVVGLEQQELEELSSKAESYLEDISNKPGFEEAEGLIRTAIGKANLLMNKKFCQFEELCRTNMDSKPKQHCATNQDLMGFWDMVYIQVKDVRAMFKKIEHLKSNQWQCSTGSCVECLNLPSSNPHKVLTIQNPSSKKTYPVSKNKSSEDARRRLSAARAAGLRKKTIDSPEEIKIYLPSNANKEN